MFGCPVTGKDFIDQMRNTNLKTCPVPWGNCYKGQKKMDYESQNM
jgi:hypothetical protein